MSPYEPDWKEGEVKVCFNFPISEQSAEGFGEEKLGYKLKGEMKYGYGIPGFLYEVPEDKEEEAVEKFEKMEIVKWAEKRDLKVERQLEKVDEVERKVEEEIDKLMDSVGTEDYESQLEKFQGLIGDSE
ncbi:MAG: hypothetical protein ACLFTQ_00310 [Candidatus Aenigmatarchaeota archaeon]